MKNVNVGSTVRNPDKRPPWIVVNHSLQSVIVAKWPGKLWKVEIIATAAEQPNATAQYTRAVAVRVLEELPVTELFGPHGASVSNVIEKTRTLELNDVQALGKSASSPMRDAYSRAWSNWLAQIEPNSAHRNEDHGGTLAISGEHPRSPIGVGFSVLYSVLADRARKVTGDAAFITNDEGEQYFAPEWDAAFSALLGAAMAYGAPELVTSVDRATLSFAWIGTFGELHEKKNDA